MSATRSRDGLLLAVGSLTAFPVPPPRAVERATGRAAMLLAWVPGLLLAAGWVLLALAATRAGLPPLVVGLLSVAWLLLATRAFHADGLADTVDGLAASYDRDRALAVMKTGDVGPAGASALVVALGLQAACLGQLAAEGRLALGAAAIVLSRAVLPVACVPAVPSARPGGLGALVAGTVPAGAAVLLVGAVGALAVLAAGPGALAALAGALGWALLLLRRATSRLGGITGDVLGALVEGSLACALVGALLA